MPPGLDQFLADYPGMAIVPSVNPGLELRGEFSFCGQAAGKPDLTDTYSLEIAVPPAFPNAIPRVTETGRRIPRDSANHINPDGTLCLGSPLRLLSILKRNPTLNGFAESCLVPYLYAASHKERFGGAFVFDELEHGSPGALQDYMQLFGFKRPEQVRAAWHLLGMNERRANERSCPCGCGNRLGRCSFNDRLRAYRKMASRAWFKRNAP